LLDVSGMKCGGCSAAVKRILMENSDIKSAAVNLLTESAVFKVPANSDKEALGEKAANLLTKQVQLLRPSMQTQIESQNTLVQKLLSAYITS